MFNIKDMSEDKGVKMTYLVIEREAFNVIGIRLITPYGGGTWGIVKNDGTNNLAKELFGQFFDLGLCFGFEEDGSNDYMCAVASNQETPGAFDSFTFPATNWLIFEAIGTITGQTLTQVWECINTEYLPQSDYKQSHLPTIEKYISWDEAADICNVEIWIPVYLK